MNEFGFNGGISEADQKELQKIGWRAKLFIVIFLSFLLLCLTQCQKSPS